MDHKRIERLDRHIAQGTLLRGKWGDGHERACLLVALAPEVITDYGSAAVEACPASVMPQWLAHMTVGMDDEGSTEAWPEMVRTFAALARRWHRLDEAAWQRVEAGVKFACLAIARPFAPSGPAHSAVVAAQDILRSAKSSAPVYIGELVAAREAARKALREAEAEPVWSMRISMRAAAETAMSAMAADGDGDESAAATAHNAAALVGYAEYEAAGGDGSDYDPRVEAMYSARRATWDLITSTVFNAIREELSKARGAKGPQS